MGDFTCTVDQPEMQVLFKRTRLQPPDHRTATFPSWAPQRAIDHVLVSDGIRALASAATPAAFSDHLALSVELEIPDIALE